ncbi:hypothetical protein GALMADRAFT_224291 [Galerina marginata CBS 339.88]|uniref:DUF6593 domain-containing protein n=1 Tax=Galerina marginata (strain CBS 339.88) TaxID=685588 RepID=A0A067T786_GALM3|nr:hypothetical protein GALMADRAFT_224291 [Galerina marginata CBS 339.88]
MSAPLILVLHPDNPCNTIITDCDTGEVIYTVSTVHGKQATTYVKDAEGTTVAHWEWRDVRSDILTLGSAKPMSASTWLHKNMLPFHRTVTFRDHQNRTFKWKNVEGGGQMELYSEDDKQNPMVAFLRSLRYTDRKVDPSVEVRREATLTLDSRGQEIMNLAIVSFLILEKGRRSRETSQGNVASAYAGESVGSSIMTIIR